MKPYTIHLEDDAIIPDEITLLSPKENLLMLLVGFYSIHTIKKTLTEDKYKEYTQQINEHYSKILETKEQNIRELQTINSNQKTIYDGLVQEEKEKRIQEIMFQLTTEKQKMDSAISNITDVYTAQHREIVAEKQTALVATEKLIQQLAIAQITIENQQKEMNNLVAIQIMKEKERMVDFERAQILKNTALQDKLNELLIEREREENRRLNDSVSHNNKCIGELNRNIQELKKGNIKKGQIGENYFHELIQDTFAEYDDFKIINTTKLGHTGDFIMQFKDFTILADSKNFTTDGGVSSTDRNKLNVDMNLNQYIKIAWMVSLDKPIRKFSKYPYMIDIKDGVCYCYINSLLDYENPQKLLTMVWYACSVIFHSILNHDDDSLMVLEKYRKNETRIRGVVERMKKKSKERYLILKQLTDNFDSTKQDIQELLYDEIMSIFEIHKRTVETWWKENMERVEGGDEGGGGALKTDKIYGVFKEENPEITNDVFKQILKDLIPDDLKLPKSKTSQYTVLNHIAKFVV